MVKPGLANSFPAAGLAQGRGRGRASTPIWLTYVGCCIRRLLWTSIRWITS